MKKHLLALAVAGVVAAPAMAQNVSVYGIVDTAIQSYDNGLVASPSSITRSNDGVLASSRLGIKGSEDLGGGMKAVVNLEQSLTPSTGAGTNWTRAAFVGLAGAFGEVRLGKGDTTYTQDIDSGVSQAGNLALRPKIHTTAASGVSGEIGGDVDNAVRYISPSMNGLSLELGFATNASTATTDAQTDISDVFLKYEKGPLKALIGNAKQNNATSTSKADFTAYGVSYDFGVASVGLSGSSADANLAGDVKTTILSAKAPLGNGLAVHLVRGTASVSGVSNAEGSGTTIALTKAMSKRTTVYAGYTSVSSKSAATFTMTGVTAGALDSDPTAMTVGISHSF
jgi:predicted porin